MNLPIAPLSAAVLGAAAAIGAASLPAPVLEGLVMDSGVASVIAAAEPPLGATARAAVVLGAGGLVALLVWLTLFVLVGTRSLSVGGGAARRRSSLSSGVQTPVLRRADAHPDAPARPPLLATRDLGTPFLEVHAGGKAPEPVVIEDAPLPIGPSEAARPEPVVAMSLKPEFVAEEPAPAAIGANDEPVEPGIALSATAAPVVEAEPIEKLTPENFTKVAPVEQDVPADLEQPLSAFDPSAILPVPLPPSAPVAPLHRPRPQIFSETERFEAFELVPPIADVPAPKVKTPPILAPEPLAKPETEASVHALLDRLERGVSRKTLASRETAHRREAERGLEDTLATLRNLARGNSITA